MSKEIAELLVLEVMARREKLSMSGVIKLHWRARIPSPGKKCFYNMASFAIVVKHHGLFCIWSLKHFSPLPWDFTGQACGFLWQKALTAIKKETQTFLFITWLAVFLCIYCAKFIPCVAQLKPIRIDLAHVYMRKVATIKIYCLITRAMVAKCLCV